MSYNSAINPSRFNRRITVVRATTFADDAFGTATTGYDTEFVSWAHWEELSTSRKAYYGLDLFTVFAEVLLRYSPDRPFDTSSIVYYQNQYWSVVDAKVEIQEYKRFWRLIVTISAVQ